MTKVELVREVCAVCGDLRQGQVEAVVSATFEKITEALANGEEVKIKDFGNFVVKTKAERTGTNPGTGAKIVIPASKVVKFKVSKALKEEVK